MNGQERGRTIERKDCATESIVLTKQPMFCKNTIVSAYKLFFTNIRDVFLVS